MRTYHTDHNTARRHRMHRPARCLIPRWLNGGHNVWPGGHDPRSLPGIPEHRSPTLVRPQPALLPDQTPRFWEINRKSLGYQFKHAIRTIERLWIRSTTVHV
jgi:hypothetical protein